MTKKLMLLAACAATVLLGSGVAQADPAPAPGPDPKGPKCTIFNGGDDHDKFEIVPCGWAYGDNMGWYPNPS
jgi:hypothetical protein